MVVITAGVPDANGMIAPAPATPAGPVAPVGPAGPVAPAGPAAPAEPSLPETPAGPTGPVGPEGPVAPVGPAGPCAPPPSAAGAHCPSNPLVLSKHTTVSTCAAVVRNGIVTGPVPSTCISTLAVLSLMTKLPPDGVCTTTSAALAGRLHSAKATAMALARCLR